MVVYNKIVRTKSTTKDVSKQVRGTGIDYLVLGKAEGLGQITIEFICSDANPAQPRTMKDIDNVLMHLTDVKELPEYRTDPKQSGGSNHRLQISTDKAPDKDDNEETKEIERDSYLVLVDSDLQLVKSAHTVNSISSLGGDITDIVVSEDIGTLWDEIKNSELSSSVVGEYEVRCIYVRNNSLNNETMQQCQVWIEQNTASPFTDIDIAVGTAFTGDTEQTVANEDTLPQNVAWTFARGEENAEFLGDIAKDQGKSLWIRRHAGPAKSGSSYPSDNYILRFKFLRTGALSPPPPPGPSPGPDPTKDPFGIRMVYKTQTQGTVSTPFYMNMNDPLGDCRFMSQTTITKQGDGSWSMGPGARVRAFTSGGGCRHDVIWTKVLDTYDHDTWGDREWMNEPNDWKNVEITCYFKALSFSTDTTKSGNRKLYLYSRGLRHNTGVAGGCSGTAYKGVTYQEQGELKWHKEAFHDGSQPCGDRNIQTFKTGVDIPGINVWWGMKVMMWNYPNPTNPNIGYVHLELWLDLSGTDTWVKMGERDDTGGWYPGMPSTTCPGDENCGGHQDQIIKWGGPITEMRMDDGYDSVAFKWYSVREIIPGVTVTPPPPPPEPGPPPAPPPPGPSTDPFGITQLYISKVGGSIYAATSWDNDEVRTFGNTSDCAADPFDSRVQVSDAGDPKIDIDGNGIMKAGAITGNSGSPRIRVKGTWQNVEATVYVRATTPNMVANFDLRTKTDHYCPGSETLFGGYIVNVAFDTQKVGFRKEKSHGIGYSSRLAEVSVTLAANTWYGFKAVSYNVANGVKLECYMDTTDGANGGTWTKISETADTGTWFESVDQQSCQGSAIRTNHNLVNGFLEYKWWSVREITPPP